MRRGLILAAAAIALTLGGCGYNGSYRYECQDPEKWDAEECNPPMCLVDGMCTETLLGFDPNEVTDTTDQPIEDSTPDTTIATEETTAP